ncbi:hypothetical protein OJ252_2083 [Cryptosporidium canis]|uniref:Uncharacterized protein n=1 Tax=Cryptosporidium canis TaxID=195482 RepID=A0ABQ8P697_9CRYT|nr:hypothetical protein OJ252_2083 [Cryptosporidium canis]
MELTNNSETGYKLNPLIFSSCRNSLPQIVNVPHLSCGRKSEICRYINFIKKSNSTKRCFQRLPPSIRRRSMSYNIYRAPRRIRSTLSCEMMKAPPRISRHKKKDRKKLPWIKRNILLRAINRENFFGTESFPFKTRNKEELSIFFRNNEERVLELPFNQFKWMESHLYHSKRFHMCDAFGYKLPIHSTSKRNRKIYRALKHGFVVHDSSYLQIFELRGAQEDISLLFKLCKFDVNFLLNPEYLNCNFRGGGFSFKLNESYLDNMSLSELHTMQINTYTWTRVAPIEFLWTPKCKNCNSDQSLWVWIHPISSHEQFFYWEKCIKLFELRINIYLVEDINRFEFLGPKSLDFIEQFRSNGSSQVEIIDIKQDFINNIDLNFPMTYLSNKLSNEYARINNKCTSIFKESCNCSFFCVKYRDKIREIFNSAKNPMKNKNANHKYYSSFISTQNVRSRKRNIRTILSKITERNENKIHQNNSNTIKKETPIKKLVTSKILIIFHQGANIGFDLIFPRGLNSSLLLRYLHSHSAQIIGIGERRKLLTQLGTPMFPFDFIETQSYQKLLISSPIYTKSKDYLNEISNEVISISNFIKTPPSKRINYLFNKIEFPFLINWEKISNESSEVNSTFQRNYFVLNQIVSAQSTTSDKYKDVKNYNVFVNRIGYRGTEKERDCISLFLSVPEMKTRVLLLVKITSTHEIKQKTHIYMCEKDDIEEIKRKNYLVEIPNKHGKVSIKGNSNNQLGYLKDSNSSFSTRRKLVGVVTSGGYSMSMRKGIGIGYISYASFHKSHTV